MLHAMVMPQTMVWEAEQSSALDVFLRSIKATLKFYFLQLWIRMKRASNSPTRVYKLLDATLCTINLVVQTQLSHLSAAQLSSLPTAQHSSLPAVLYQ